MMHYNQLVPTISVYARRCKGGKCLTNRGPHIQEKDNSEISTTPVLILESADWSIMYISKIDNAIGYRPL